MTSLIVTLPVDVNEKLGVFAVTTDGDLVGWAVVGRGVVGDDVGVAVVGDDVGV